MTTKIQPLRLPRSLLSKDRPNRWTPGFSTKTALDHLDELNVSLAERPDADPVMPQDITSISGEELGRLMAQFIAFGEFLNAQVALAEIAAEEDETSKDLLEAEIRLRKAGTVADKTAKVRTDAEYIEQQQRCLNSKAKAKLLRAMSRRYEKCASGLSREQTRRQPYTGRE